MAQSIWWQYCLPQHLLSRMMGWLANCRCQRLKNFAVRKFIKHFDVDLSEAIIDDYQQYQTFNDFFTRHLRPEVRPIASATEAIASPVDGVVSAVGYLQEQTILQAKGKDFTLTSLLANAELAKQYVNGSFLTAYLSPRDYHRIHFPCAAKLKAMHYVPGKLFSVNETSVAKIDRLFARNERVICQFDSAQGPFLLIAVGAMIVGSISVAWHGVVNSPRAQKQDWHYASPIEFQKGDEFGFFKLGSTVILLFPHNRIAWESHLTSGSTLKMGQHIARILV